MADLNLTEQELVRRNKLSEYEARGVAPFGHAFNRTHRTKEIIDMYADKTKEELAEMNVTASIAGRIMTKRDMGKAAFMHIQDRDEI